MELQGFYLFLLKNIKGRAFENSFTGKFLPGPTRYNSHLTPEAQTGPHPLILHACRAIRQAVAAPSPAQPHESDQTNC